MDDIHFYSFRFVKNSNGRFRNLMKTGLGSSQDLNEYRKMKKMQEVYTYEQQRRRIQTPITFYGNVQNNTNHAPLFFDQQTRPTNTLESSYTDQQEQPRREEVYKYC